MRGFDRDEVTQFLARSPTTTSRRCAITTRPRGRSARRQAQLDELREHERNLRNTLLTAQKLADEIRGNAEQEAKRIIREAEGRAPTWSSRSPRPASRTCSAKMDNIRMKRKDAESTLESTIATLRNSLEFIRSQDAKEREEKLALHRPRPVEAPLPTPSLALRAVEQGDVAQAR